MRLAICVLSGTMLGLAAGQGCNEPDYECGERNLPGTEGCPCLPGDVCAQDLVCAAGVCLSEAPAPTGGEAGMGASSGTDAGTGTTTGATAAASSDTGTAGGTTGG